jgi:hypothetical protein
MYPGKIYDLEICIDTLSVILNNGMEMQKFVIA